MTFPSPFAVCGGGLEVVVVEAVEPSPKQDLTPFPVCFPSPHPHPLFWTGPEKLIGYLLPIVPRHDLLFPDGNFLLVGGPGHGKTHPHHLPT